MAGNFIVYLIGYIIAIIGVGFLLLAAGVGQQWILAAVLILIGLGVVFALSRSQRDAAYRGKSSGGTDHSHNTPRERPSDSTGGEGSTRA